MGLRAIGLLCLVAPALPAQAAWVQAPGAHYLKVWDQVLIGDRAFDVTGQIVQLPASYHEHALRLYFEYGLDEALTVVVRGTPLGISSFGEEVTAFSGLMSVGLRAGLVRGDLPVALELSYGWAPPLGDKPLAEGVVETQRFRIRPAFEQHVGQAELQLGWAGSWGWVKATGGVIATSAEGISPVAEASIRLGSSASFGLEGDLGVVAHLPFEAPSIIDVTGTGATRYVGLHIGVGYWLTSAFGVRLDLGFAPYAESNAATPSIGIGIQSR